MISAAPMLLASNVSVFADSETSGSEVVVDDGDNPEGDYAVDTSFLDDIASTDENSDLTINVLANDWAYFGDKSIMIDSVSSPPYGNVIINSDNTVTYRPSQLRLPGDSVVSDTFDYSASYNNGALQYTATVIIDIHQANDGPLVVDSELVAANDKEFSFYLKAYDEDNDSLTFFIASFQGMGEYALNPVTGLVTYLQYPGYTGEDLMVYGVRDEDSTSALARVSIVSVEGTGTTNSEQVEEEPSDISYDYFNDHFSEEEEEGEPSVSDTDDEQTDDHDSSNDSTNTDTEGGPGSSTNGTSSDTNSTNNAPIADAGSDMEVLNGALVELDGSASNDPDGDQLTYAWAQASGSPVTLLDSEGTHPTFVAPQQIPSDLTLTFELVVSDGNLTSQASTVAVTVLAAPPPDSENTPCTESVPIDDISASDSEPDHPPSDAIDQDVDTRWSNDGIGSWITLDLGAEMNICGIDIDWYQGDDRSSVFTVSVSADGTDYSEVYDDESSGTNPSVEQYDLPTGTVAKFVRITVNGNSENEIASITEIALRGSG